MATNSLLDNTVAQPMDGTFSSVIATPTNNSAGSSVANQLTDILSTSSPLSKLAESRSNEIANQSGLLSSSLAVGAGQKAVIDSALPIATSDANTQAQFEVSAQEAGQTSALGEQTAFNNTALANTQGAISSTLQAEQGTIASEQADRDAANSLLAQTQGEEANTALTAQQGDIDLAAQTQAEGAASDLTAQQGDINLAAQTQGEGAASDLAAQQGDINLAAQTQAEEAASAQSTQDALEANYQAELQGSIDSGLSFQEAEQIAAQHDSDALDAVDLSTLNNNASYLEMQETNAANIADTLLRIDQSDKAAYTELTNDAWNTYQESYLSIISDTKLDEDSMFNALRNVDSILTSQMEFIDATYGMTGADEWVPIDTSLATDIATGTDTTTTENSTTDTTDTTTDNNNPNNYSYDPLPVSDGYTAYSEFSIRTGIDTLTADWRRINNLPADAPPDDTVIINYINNHNADPYVVGSLYGMSEAEITTYLQENDPAYSVADPGFYY